MARVIGNIPNFINGISQQPAALRLPSQAQNQVNCYSTVAKGLIRRPPTDHVCKISSSQSDTAFVHVINRDVTERYILVYDTAHSATDPNLLTQVERAMTGWTKTAGCTAVQTNHTTEDPSVDGETAFHRCTFDGTVDEGILLSNFVTVAGNTAHTFSIWLRLKTNTTLTGPDNKIYLYGSDFVATGQDINSLVYNQWTKFEVTSTSIASPTGTVNILVRCEEAVDIDVQWPQFEAASAATNTVALLNDKPKLKVFDFSGTEYEVFAPDGDAYLTPVNDAETDLVGLTVADYTFLANKEVTVASGGTNSPAQNPTALISFGTIQPGSTVELSINDTTVATQLISDTDPSELETNWVAAQILADLVAAGYNTGNWTSALTENDGSVIRITNTAGTDFKVTVRDGSNGLGIKIVKDKVQYFEDLPRQGSEGFKVEVAGDPVTGFGNYWVEFETDGIPVWKETVKPGIEIDLDASTLPMALTRNASGTFTLKELDWTDRAVGDEDNNPMPSFVGEKINDMFFYKSRFAFCSGEGVQMSEAGEFFNFFRSTVTTLVDGDPIDVASNHTKVSILRFAVPYQEQLLLFSDQTQFRLTSGDILSPSTVGIEPITEFESSQVARPAAIGNFIFFGVEKSDFASVREYFVADDSQRNDGREITGHIPNYIPAGIAQIEGTSNEDVMIIRSSGSTDASEVYVYKFFWSGNEKVQSSWSKWTFPDVTAILGYKFIKSTCYFVFKRADGVFLEKIEMDTGAQDDSGTGYNFRLDRKVFSSDASVSSAYNAGLDQTTFTFTDITWKSVPIVIGCAGNTEYSPGLYVDIVGSPTTYNANTIVVSGDATGEDFAFGVDFESEYEISEIVAKAPGPGGGSVPITEGRLQIMWLNLRYADTGYMTVTVTPERRDANVYEFNGRTLGSLENPLNDVPVDTAGFFRVPVYSRSDRVRIVVTSSDPLPFRLISADWIGNLRQRFKRI